MDLNQNSIASRRKLPFTLLRPLGLSLAAAALAFAGACGEDEHEHEHSPIEELCEHFADGPFQAVTASSDAASAPSATFEHTRVNVTLPAGASMNEGFVHLDMEAAGDVLIGLSQAVPLRMARTGGAELMPERTEMVTECGEVAVTHVFDVEVGRYDLQLGPTSESVVGIGFEMMGGHSDHDHDHDHGD